MYLIKTKKQLEEQDIQELLERKQKHSELYHSEPGEARTEFRPEELPDGACFQPKAVESNVDNSDAATRMAEYIGSFSVVGKDQASRVQYVQKQLEGMRNVTNSKQVLLVISLSGVKVCSSNGQSVYMAHALKRISYATCDPDHNQFSFLAREPKGHINVQFCHAFVTKSPRAAEELNTIIGNAFKMAYAAQREKQPTFHELIEAQVAEQQAAFRESQEAAKRALQAKLTEIATPTPFSDKARTRMEMRRQTSDEGLAATLQRFRAEQGEEKEKEGNAGGAGKSKVWAKQLVETVRHHSPLSSDSTLQLRHTRSPQRSTPNTNNSRPVTHDLSATPTSSSSVASKRNSAPPSSDSGTGGGAGGGVFGFRGFGGQNNAGKFKGSPVTALKDEIDRRYLSNGDSGGGGGREGADGARGSVYSFESAISHSRQEISSGGLRQVHSEQQFVHQMWLANRPLPAVPSDGEEGVLGEGGFSLGQGPSSNSPRRGVALGSGRGVWRSLDDSSVGGGPGTSPRSPRRLPPAAAPLRDRPPSNGNSPRHRPARPLSEIATASSSGTLYDNRYPLGHPLNPLGYPFNNGSQQQQLPHSSSASSSSPSAAAAAASGGGGGGRAGEQEPGLYIYGPGPVGGSPSHRVASPHRMSAGQGRRVDSPHRRVDSPQRVREVTASPPAGAGGGGGHSRGERVDPVLRYQNDSPFQGDLGEEGETPAGKRPGLESLMCLDRSHIEDEQLRHAPWYQAGIPREIALEILAQEEVGSFIVRDSTTHPGCFALSVRVPKYEKTGGISHYLILKTSRGVKLKGLDKEWPSLTALVTHHTVMPEMLPCTLRLPRTANNPTFKDSDRDDPDPDPDYQRLADFSSMMAQLKM